MKPLSVCIASLLLPSLCIASYTVTLEPGGQECFILRALDTQTMVSGNYDVLNDQIDGTVITATLELADTPHTVLWKSNKGATEETFQISVKARTRLEFCVEMDLNVDDDIVDSSYGIPIGFNLHIRPTVERTLDPSESGPDAQRALKLKSQADTINNDWHNLVDHFDFLRNREAQHQVLTSQILSRVMGWTLLEASLVVCMALGQVMYWKKFFEQRRYL